MGCHYLLSSDNENCLIFTFYGSKIFGEPVFKIFLGGRREEGSGWGTRVYLWWIHVDIWQNQYNTVKLKNEKKIIENTMESFVS